MTKYQLNPKEIDLVMDFIQKRRNRLSDPYLVTILDKLVNHLRQSKIEKWRLM